MKRRNPHPGAVLRDRAALRPGMFLFGMDHELRPDVTAHVPDVPKRSQILREQAERCRRLAGSTTDRAVSRRLLELAEEFEERAAAEEGRSRCPDEPL
jgi:exopolyphosphatase/pppGpp-phosphohydrolase